MINTSVAVTSYSVLKRGNQLDINGNGRKAVSEQTQEATFVLQRIYVKDVSFESPKSPEAFLKQWKPSVALELTTSNVSIGEDNFEVTLGLTVTAKNEAEDVIYLIELQQSGIFLIKGMDDRSRAGPDAR